VGLQWRRLGRASVNLYDYGELIEAGESRDSEEGLRLFHVAATRARERLILSGVVKPEPAKETKPGTPVVERLVDALGAPRPGKDEDEPEAAGDGDAGPANGGPVDGREPAAPSDGTGNPSPSPSPTPERLAIAVPAPEPRPGLEETFAPSEIAVHLNLPSPERAAELRDLHLDATADRELGSGTPPLVERKPPVVPSRPLSYTAISAFEECAYRFYMERVLGLPSSADGVQRVGTEGDEGPSAREERSARGAAVHALLEWSQANGWREPNADLARRHALAAGLDLDRPATTGAAARSGPDGAAEELLGPVRDWLGSPLREEIAAASRVRAEVPILLGAGGTVLRGSIDLLVERDGAPPLVVDYKTDRLRGEDPSDRASHYEVQRSIYAMAAAESLGASEVEVAYVFLERADTPVRTLLTAADMESARARIASTVTAIGAGNFSPAPEPDRTWDLCRGCPALGRLCSGPPR
jgi:ATP-dependent exoDNAse (exonuclease V) beta subunit